MKKLILIRHASALPEQFPQKDFDRELSEAGKQEAGRLAQFLLAKKGLPDVVLASAAKRTWNTAEIIGQQFGESGISPASVLALYNAGYSVLLDQVKNLASHVHSAMLVGHNPGISQLATMLSNQHPYQFSTSAALFLEFPVESWQEIRQGTGREIWYYCP